MAEAQEHPVRTICGALAHAGGESFFARGSKNKRGRIFSIGNVERQMPQKGLSVGDEKKQGGRTAASPSRVRVHKEKPAGAPPPHKRGPKSPLGHKVPAGTRSAPAPQGKKPRERAPAPALLEKAGMVLRLLQQRYPAPQTHLVAGNPWELLVATVLSAQCTDARVNMVTPDLFRRWPTPESLAEAALEEVEACIRSTGFYHNKAKNLVAAARRVTDVYGGEVPRTMEDLCTLGGVARKTANVVLWGAFGLNEGLAVDTHVARIAFRLGLTSGSDPVRTERELTALFPREEWGNVNHRLVWFGRHVCIARTPLCGECEFASICPQHGLV